MSLPRPKIKLIDGHERRVRAGHPWIFSNEIRMDVATKALPLGSLVQVIDHRGASLGLASFNPHSLIAGRILDRDPDTVIDRNFFIKRIEQGLALRKRLFKQAFYRLIHGEADCLPGLIIDRYDDVLVLQINSAGFDRLQDMICEALENLLKPRAIILRNDSPLRRLEGLSEDVKLAKGNLTEPVYVTEGGVEFICDPLDGQKTGWFFDLAEARRFVASLAKGGKMLDVYCHTGAFALQAAKAGAIHVTALDRSELAIALARQTAERNGLKELVQFEVADAFESLERRRDRKEQYDMVVCDPPSFVKSKKELPSGIKGYRKLARLAAPLVVPGGFLFIASCSHHVPVELFGQEVARGLNLSDRSGRIVMSGGAAPDHPVHPILPETAYIKWQVLQLD